MIHDALGMHSYFGENVEETPNEEAHNFYKQLCDASCPLSDESPHSQLSIAVRLSSIKPDWNVTQGAMDSIRPYE